MPISYAHTIIRPLYPSLQQAADLLHLAQSCMERRLQRGGQRPDEIAGLNIGGGPHFYRKGWLNLEEAPGILNPRPFRLTADCRFPAVDRSIKMVYSSHCFEHLDPPTVRRVLNEARRVLADGGQLVVKLPDYEGILERWRMGDLAYFDENWALDSAVWTWPNRGVPETLDYKAAMIFCGFWNGAYGNPYTGEVHRNTSAYHGPPPVEAGCLHELLETGTPRQISLVLRQAVIDQEKDFTFNHQNAWDRGEFKALLAETGFGVVADDPFLIMARNSAIPGICKMMNISMYFQAEKS